MPNARNIGKNRPSEAFLNKRLEMTTTTVVNRRKESEDVYIGRGSKWGNPYTHISGKETLASLVVGSRDEAIDLYRKYILARPDLLSCLPELRNKRLGCYCSPLRCHGDVLIELLNELDQQDSEVLNHLEE